MNSVDELRSSQTNPGLILKKIHGEGEINRRLYQEVGSRWQWTDRLSWSAEQWQAWAARAEVVTFVAFFQGEEVGYAELEKQDEGHLEIVYFGLKERHLGKGLGGAFLSQVVQEAWNFPETRRVWVHTCTEDHEHALANYEARGFRVFRVEE